MGWSRVGGPRLLGAVLLATILSCAGYALPAAAASGSPVPGATGSPSPTTTTLPLLPNVAPAYTNGQPAQTLLDNAVALSSLGLDDTALATAVAATQAKLDADAIAVRNAQDALAAATGREDQAKAQLNQAQGEFSSMAAAVRQAVVFLYTSGPESLYVNPGAGRAALFAQAYAASTVGPYGVLARRQAVEQDRAQAVADVDRETRTAAAASRDASKALADQQVQLTRLQSELASAGTATVAAVTADHSALAGQAGKELLSDSALQFTPKAPVPPPVATTSVALTWAFAQLAKQYVWGATGPDTFDCSGLTQYVWKAAGVAIPRVAADQDTWTIPVPLSQLLPGDLVFFGTTDIHHVGIYIGDGLMINAPHTGTVVQVSSIWWSDLAGFGRVHSEGVPVPTHNAPTPLQPAPKAVVAKAGPVPSQTKAPPGWTPTPGSSAPISLGSPPSAPVDPSATSTTSTSVGDSTTTTVDPAIPDPSTSIPSTTDTTSTTSSPDSTTTAPPAP